MTVLVTGVAGFIGRAVAEALLDRGDPVVGLDCFTAYSPRVLKDARLATLAGRAGFAFAEADVADRLALDRAFEDHPAIDRIVHLAAQAGVRYSLEDPFAYLHANITGHLAVLEAFRHRADGIRHLVYASSSSVYGANREVPFDETQMTDAPLSLYGATKKADELFSHSYAHLFGLGLTGLRFFTVYGPWGRPDMAPWLFTQAIDEGRPIRLFNHGDMRRDFTFVTDIVAGVLAALDRPPPAGADVRHRVYNLGNSRPEHLRDFLAEIERAVGRRAIVEEAPMQPGDVPTTYADVSAAARDLGYAPTTPISVGVPAFVDWYRGWRDR
jgi:UDP-glucuronate 4-epimerase